MENAQEKVGGNDFIVEADEVCLGHVQKQLPHEEPHAKQYQVIHGEWWGAITRGENRMVLEELPNKKRLGAASAADVIPRVRKWIKPNTILMTDGLKAYRDINEESEYKKKNVKQRYVRHGKKEWLRKVEVDGKDYVAGTQCIDGFWGNLKQKLHVLRGVEHDHLPAYVREFQWRWCNKN